MGFKLLFICTGNTCRSPMAEGLARDMFGDMVQISSAGMSAWEGEEINAHALEILKEQNQDLSQHRARRITEELMADADWVIPMTQAQEESLKRLFPQYETKTRCLGNWGDSQKDILDPWMGSLNVYRQTAKEISELLSELKEKLRLEG
ncbi:low molecular weight protein arginine phosphatase [Desulfosporosinus sp. BICA1-9]|uniref:low molecular weight protein arginine phosphatase n=1 Tax=Desulfosporosinus sp. BICA1-9 TaxID=1531958 RepID=UPI00054BD0C6|nr:low molecular weight protein arginine phosphatase [Desulfosporosinus sp. BICA1-9]KJS46609.1 MAG: protein tyrosine phosphatase [Peptococcaceae bacterium BRH_c23]KJS89520.1 MAG: protein tyrosine phosphatase [Desulfosporosinus sp. BICA1-9]HBW38229.1 low molecular weight protein arginine phosphatase [Desulfosporosinus sp.]